MSYAPNNIEGTLEWNEQQGDNPPQESPPLVPLPDDDAEWQPRYKGDRYNMPLNYFGGGAPSTGAIQTTAAETAARSASAAATMHATGAAAAAEADTIPAWLYLVGLGLVAYMLWSDS
jgi:hypothetical protein